MRFTLDVDADVLDAARALAVARGVSIGAALSELARRGVAARTPLSARNGFPVFQVPAGTPGFGPDEVAATASKEDLEAALEFLEPGQLTCRLLLDGSVLLALEWPTHIHHLAAHRWFAENHGIGWATCPLTQLGFVRLSMQPAVVKVPVLFGDVMEALAQMTAAGAHRFWPLTGGLADIRDEIRARVVGHHQLTDALLLNLAIRHRGRLATFDRRISGLLPPDSVLQDAVAIIPA